MMMLMMITMMMMTTTTMMMMMIDILRTARRWREQAEEILVFDETIICTGR